MSEKEILDRLWDTHHETPFASFTLERKLDLSKDQYQRVLNLLGDMSDSGEPKNGYRIKRVASTVYKMIASTQGDRGTAKGLPLTDTNERLTGQNSEGFSVGLPKNGTNEPLERFSFFNKGLDSKEATSTGTVEQFLTQIRTNASWKNRVESIRSLEEEAQKAEKAKLPAVTVSVEITSESRKRGGLRDSEFRHTNLIQADFDHHPNPNDLLDELKHDPHVRAVFASVRGRAKAFLKVSPVTSIHEHDSAWQAVVAYCQAKGYGKIDTQVKAINSLCFISHDPNALIKEATPLQWERLPEPPAPTCRPPTAPTRQEKPSPEQVQVILSFISADDYEIWMGIGMGLYREGYDFDLWDTWSQTSAKYGQRPITADKMETKWDTFGKESVNSKIRPITLGSIYYHAKEGGWTPPARHQHRHSYAERKREEKLCQIRQLQEKSLL